MSEWISVKERLPANGETVVVTSITGPFVSQYLEKAPWGPSITHWMPLPPPVSQLEIKFQEWWGNLPKADGEADLRYVGWKEKCGLISPVFQMTAKCIWNAAWKAHGE